MLAGGYRTEAELTAMSEDDKRNTLIVVLSGNSTEDVPYYQGQPNGSLIGFGGVLICLIKGNVVDVNLLKTISRANHREIIIESIENRFGKMYFKSDLQYNPDWDLVNFFIEGLRMYTLQHT